MFILDFSSAAMAPTCLFMLELTLNLAVVVSSKTKK
jgi:hypothetical protein